MVMILMTVLLVIMMLRMLSAYDVHDGLIDDVDVDTFRVLNTGC